MVRIRRHHLRNPRLASWSGLLSGPCGQKREGQPLPLLPTFSRPAVAPWRCFGVVASPRSPRAVGRDRPPGAARRKGATGNAQAQTAFSTPWSPCGSIWADEEPPAAAGPEGGAGSLPGALALRLAPGCFLAAIASASPTTGLCIVGSGKRAPSFHAFNCAAHVPGALCAKRGARGNQRERQRSGEALRALRAHSGKDRSVPRKWRRRQRDGRTSAVSSPRRQPTFATRPRLPRQAPSGLRSKRPRTGETVGDRGAHPSGDFGVRTPAGSVDLLPSSVPIVEVDTQKLKEIETGKQKAMAYQNSRRSFFGTWFGGHADFQEPELPTGMLDNPEFSLLPPKPE